MHYAPYHRSKAKTQNRNFKLSHAKRAIRTHEKDSQEIIWVYTLCGAQVKTEAKIVEYAISQRRPIIVQSFNNTPKEMEIARESRSNLQHVIRDSIELYNGTLSAKAIEKNATFVDFDSCGWFLNSLAEPFAEICQKSYMVALTVCISGPTRIASYCTLPVGMDKFSDIQSVASIAKWVYENTGMLLVDSMEYENSKGAYGMATMIFERVGWKKKKTKLPPLSERQRQIIAFRLAEGEKPASIAAFLGIPTLRVSCMSAWNSPALAAKRVNRN